MDFKEFGVKERGYSDTTGVQSPVEDRSAATRTAAIAGGAANLAGAADNYFKQENRLSKEEAKRKAKALEIQYNNRYDYSIRKYSAMYESGDITYDMAKTYIGKTRDELVAMGADTNELAQTEVNSMKTLGAKVLAEKTDMDQLRDSQWDDFMDSALGQSATSESDAKVKFAQWKSEQAKATAISSEMEQLRLEAARYQKGTDQYNEAQRNLKSKQVELVNTQLKEFPKNATAEVDRIDKQYRLESSDPTVGPAQALINAQSRVKNYFNGVRNLGDQANSSVDGGLPVQKDALFSMVDRYEKLALENMGNAKLVETMSTINKQDQTLLEIELSQMSSVREAIAARNIFGDSALATLQGVTTAALTDINNFLVDSAQREYGDPPPVLRPNGMGFDSSFKVLSDNVNDYANGSYNGDPKLLDKSVSGSLAYLGENINRLSPEKQMSILSAFESDSFGQYVKMRGLRNEDIDNAVESLSVFKENTADKLTLFVADMLGKEKAKATPATSPRMARARSYIPTRNDFDLTFEGGRVVFKGKTDRAKELAKDWNKKVSGPLTRIVRVDSNLSGEPQESVFNSWAEILWPTKDQASSAPQQTPTQDLSQYEGMAVEDEKGNVFIVRNGSYIKIRGPSNAKQ